MSRKAVGFVVGSLKRVYGCQAASSAWCAGGATVPRASRGATGAWSYSEYGKFAFFGICWSTFNAKVLNCSFQKLRWICFDRFHIRGWWLALSKHRWTLHFMIFGISLNVAAEVQNLLSPALLAHFQVVALIVSNQVNTFPKTHIKNIWESSNIFQLLDVLHPEDLWVLNLFHPDESSLQPEDSSFACRGFPN